jgi:hypothetical protein
MSRTRLRNPQSNWRSANNRLASRSKPKMKTSYYQSKKLDPKKHLVVQTSLGNPRFGKQPEWETELITPEPAVLEVAKRGGSEFEYTKAYAAQLDRHGVKAIKVELLQLENEALATAVRDKMDRPREVVLCCFCGPKKPYCHRRIFAWWWHKQTGKTIDEL